MTLVLTWDQLRSLPQHVAKSQSIGRCNLFGASHGGSTECEEELLSLYWGGTHRKVGVKSQAKENDLCVVHISSGPLFFSVLQPVEGGVSCDFDPATGMHRRAEHH